MRKVTVLLIASSIMLSMPLFSDNISDVDLFTFSPLQTASSSQVNSNFDVVQTAVNDNDGRVTTLESDAFILKQNETVTGSPSFSGTYLQVNGQLRAYGNYLYMSSGSEYLRWDTTNSRFYLSDDLYVAGGITLSGEVNKSGYTANLVPIAYGFVSSTGALEANSGNVSVTHPSTGRYEIAISGESFYYSSYIVAGACSTGEAYIFSWNSMGGKLVVFTAKISGASVDSHFSFVVYKP